MLRELCRGWPESVPALAGICDDGHYLLVDIPTASAILDQHFLDRLASCELASLRVITQFRQHATSRVPVGRLPRVFAAYVLPEPTYYVDVIETARACRIAGCPTLAIVADCIPVLRPELIPGHHNPRIDGYFRELLCFDAVSSISPETLDDVTRRLRRIPRPHDAVHLLGADGLRESPGSTSPVLHSPTPTFFLLGTLEPRKRADIALRAIARVVASGRDVRLVMAGARGSPWPALDEFLDPAPEWVTWLETATDDTVIAYLSACRATLFISEAEGYGLPALEALWHGCPIVADSSLPALAGLSAHGQIRLPLINEDTLEQAILELLDSDQALSLRMDTRRLQLPTWTDWARDIGGWVARVVGSDLSQNDRKPTS